MRIAGIDPERNFSGGEVQVLGLTLELMRAGHDAELLCDPDGVLWQRAQRAGITCRPLRIRNSLDVWAGLRLRAILGQRQYDVVHFHTARAHALAPYARRRAGALIVTRRMDYLPNRWFAPWLYNGVVQGVAAISESVAAALMARGVRREQITIIRSGVDCCRFAPPSVAVRQQARAALGIGPDEVAIGSIGALVPRKGHLNLVDALAFARDNGSGRAALDGVRCFIAGAGPLWNEIRRRLAHTNLVETVKLLGHLEEPTKLLHALDIFVMPSLSEGLGVAALEAAAVGLPVIASAVGGLREVVEDGRTGVLVRAGDTASLAQAIWHLAADQAQRAQMGREGRRWAVQRYSMELMAKQTLDLYYACLDRSQKSTDPASNDPKPDRTGC
jgi:glycosyltransferase involved in cell wall biosynthesis